VRDAATQVDVDVHARLAAGCGAVRFVEADVERAKDGVDPRWALVISTPDG